MGPGEEGRLGLGLEEGRLGPAGTRGSGWEGCCPRATPGSPESPRLSAGLCLPPCGVAGWCPSTRAAGKPWTRDEGGAFWQQLGSPLQPLLLQVLVQREHLGPLASSAHRLVRFAPRDVKRPAGEPQLELHTLDLRDYG